MEDFSNSVMIALLPVNTDWCRIDLPHLTLVSSGDIQDHPPSAYNEMAKDASMIAALSGPVTAGVQGTDVFGDEHKVDVLRFHTTPELLTMRKLVERWDKSDYPFRPHATIGPAGQQAVVLPTSVTFNRIMVGWGDSERLVWWLRR